MWIRNEDRNGQRVLDEVEIGETLWVEIQDEKGGEKNVQSGDRASTSKEVVSFEDELCKSRRE